MVQKNRASTDVIDCACVIHGSRYGWEYVEKLYNMICRNISKKVQMHVYTEHDRPVPEHMIKHVLEEWPAANVHKRGWWYKMQLFNQEHFAGDLLYFDLDVIIIRDITWIAELPTNRLWGIRDFKYLDNEYLYDTNSSIMWWNVGKFDWLWQKFKNSKLELEVKRYNGDQDYINDNVELNCRGLFPESAMTSWRWEAWEGGIKTWPRTTRYPGAGAIIPDKTSVLVFHGQPKPHELLDSVVIQQHWQ